ncbi:hypothetical protein Xen7305DRAFT_00007090 [Xenococcus sp. PCC 7305]|uniref:hypothetical protein n=1 Tax=Xenococcus sp. PCC 7305 TaxID=102125 RepID=UPI0002AC89B4|nr:hypothetical protein [Xenococcus sp. PCC 7305]ELS01008.1 hypothetical protein Xen7305DRAFT_00007090 [Xenococcus sp. PCC 7305]
MSNNVPKNKFFSRLIQLDLTSNKVSIRQIIRKNLQATIATYQINNGNILNTNQIISLLSDKIALQNSPDFSPLVYCSAITFPLANIYSLSPAQVGQELVSLLASKPQASTRTLKLQLTATVLTNGLIEFALCDRSIGWWLAGIMDWGDGGMGEWGVGEMGSWGDGEMGEQNLFPVQYVHHRCRSILLLGEREGLITLEKGKYTTNAWKITNPNLFEYYWGENLSCYYETAEIYLLQQISLIIDYFCDRVPDKSLSSDKVKNSQTWVQLSLNLSDAGLKFLAACRIFGSVAVEQRQLAIARLGLISIVQSCLSLGKKNTSNM